MIEFPKHAASLTISHNHHKSNYETVESYLDWHRALYFDSDSWLDEEDFKQSIKNQEIWECQWYPDTPVGFVRIYASSFEKLCQFMRRYCSND